jgi:hypothetical protein
MGPDSLTPGDLDKLDHRRTFDNAVDLTPALSRRELN